jgi:hypothetical protein
MCFAGRIQEIKKPTCVGFLLKATSSISLAAECHQQAQQIDEQVVNIQEQSQRRHHVIGFAAMHDPADVIQDIGREDQHGDRGDGQ